MKPYIIPALLSVAMLVPFPVHGDDNLALTATASASSYYDDGQSGAAQCNDGTVATRWQGQDRSLAPSSYYWLRLDFGSSIRLARIRLDALTRQLGQETWFSKSEDGVAWSDVPGTTHTDGPGEPSVLEHEPDPFEARYLQLNSVWPTSSGQPGVGEFEAYGSLEGGIEITSLHGHGMLTWQGAMLHSTCRVEWAASLSDSGPVQWCTLTNLVVTNQCAMAAAVPMYFRVVGKPAGTHIAGYTGDADWHDKHLAEDGDWDTYAHAVHSNRELLACHPYNGIGPRYWRFKYSSSGSEWQAFSCHNYETGLWERVYDATGGASARTVTVPIPSACLKKGHPIRMWIWSCDPPSTYYEGEILESP